VLSAEYIAVSPHARLDVSHVFLNKSGRRRLGKVERSEVKKRAEKNWGKQGRTEAQEISNTTISRSNLFQNDCVDTHPNLLRADNRPRPHDAEPPDDLFRGPLVVLHQVAADNRAWVRESGGSVW
jgi:hypothetical protein